MSISKIRNTMRVKDIHFIGIGGVGMSGIAEVLLTQGYGVSGSDKSESAITEKLRNLGAKIDIGHSPNNVKDADVVVISSAISQNNPELLEAYQSRKPVLMRAQMLAEIMRFHYGIAISGTHGKTTTTSLTASVLAAGKLDPTFVVGGLLNSTGENAKLGKGKHFVVEADESDGSFLQLNPIIAAVTNIDADHMNTYGDDFSKLCNAFLKFIHKLPFYGLAIMCGEDHAVQSIMPEIARPTLTYGLSDNFDIWASDIEQKGMVSKYKVHFKACGTVLDVQLNLPGKHNVLNSLAAIAIGRECNVKDAAILKALKNFKGVNRRLQFHGELNISKEKRVFLVDDYGHHPNEIKVSLDAMRKAWPGKRLVLAFQPHRYTRTKALFEEFSIALSHPDALLLLEIYPASETPIIGVDSVALAGSIRRRGKIDPVYVKNIDDLLGKLNSVLCDGDILLLQGAGSIGSVVSKLKESSSLV